MGEGFVGRAEVDVHSGRFAGALQSDATAGLKDAELRVSDPARPQRAVLIRV